MGLLPSENDWARSSLWLDFYMQHFPLAAWERKEDIPSQCGKRSLALGAVVARAPLSETEFAERFEHK